MQWFKKLKSKSEDYLLDHPAQKKMFNWSFIFCVEVVSAFFYSIGIKSFVNPSTECVEIWMNQSGNNDITNAHNSKLVIQSLLVMPWINPLHNRRILKVQNSRYSNSLTNNNNIARRICLYF